MAISETLNQLIKIASFIIPIKLLFLAADESNSLPIPGLETTLSFGQLEVALIAGPVGALVFISTIIDKNMEENQKHLEGSISACINAEKSDKSFITAIARHVSKFFCGTLLMASTFAIMSIFLFRESLIIILIFMLIFIIFRHNVRILISGTDGSDKARMKELRNEVSKAQSRSSSMLQFIILPVFVYLLSGAIIEGRLDPVFGIAYILLFRLFIAGRQSVSLNLIMLALTSKQHPDATRRLTSA